MSADSYMTEIGNLITKIHETQLKPIVGAAEHLADVIAADHVVHAFGSGHSVIPVMDLFPRYGSFVGFHPIMDSRLMWTTVVGSGGAPEVLWQERQEGYVEVMLPAHKLLAGDAMIVYSHGGMNPAPVEMALAAQQRQMKVIAITSIENRAINAPTHSSGKSLSDIADFVIDNCSPPEDALVSVPGLTAKVGASSTVTAVAITMALLAETAAQLEIRGALPERAFVSPNVPGISKDNNDLVYNDYIERIHFR